MTGTGLGITGAIGAQTGAATGAGVIPGAGTDVMSDGDTEEIDEPAGSE